MRQAALAILLLLACADNLSAQTESFVPFEGLAADLQRLKSPSQGAIALRLQGRTQEFVWYALGSAVYASFVEEGRIDKQVGASGQFGLH